MTEPDVIELLIQRGTPAPFVDTTGTQYTYAGPHGQVRSTPDGGWLATMRVERQSPVASTYIVVGQRGDALDGPVEVFLIPDPEVNQQLTIYGAASGADGRIGWIEWSEATGFLPLALHLDDQRLLSRFDDIAGAPGWRWNQFNGVTLTENGGIFVSGVGLEPTIGNAQPTVANVGTGEMLLNGFDFVPGLSRRIAQIQSFRPSTDGLRWGAVVQTRATSQEAVIVDGELLELAPGFKALEGEPLPPSVAARIGEGTWLRFLSCHVNRGGDVVIEAQATAGGVFQALTLFNGSIACLGGECREVVQLTNDGALLTSRDGEFFGQASLITSAELVDADRDGVADPGYSDVNFLQPPSASASGAPIYFFSLFKEPDGTNRGGLFRTRSTNAGSTVCTAVPNSTGRRGSMMAVGSPVAVDSDLTLEVFGLPRNARGYALFSRALGTPFTPQGSEGTLCLGGAIGRLQTQLFLTGESGTAGIELDLNGLPQPTGSVAAIAGDTWYAQAWHRDLGLSGPTSNFTDAIEVAFD
ncbi:hypothetical protein [Planctomycetes bacterium Poly30]|uniref:hypothetical protein n=1 Tax=Saltatorellus ferox TaxID=2528018 RepID=UPI0011A84297